VFKKLILLGLLLGLGFGVMVLTTRGSHFEVHTTLDMDESPARVWQHLVQVADWPRWWPGVERVVLECPLAIGTKIGLQLRGRPEQDPAIVVRLEPGSQLVWQRNGVFGSRAGTGVLLQRAGTGSKVQVSNTIDGPQAFLARFTGREAFVKYQRTLLAALQKDLGSSPVVEQKKD